MSSADAYGQRNSKTRPMMMMMIGLAGAPTPDQPMVVIERFVSVGSLWGVDQPFNQLASTEGAQASGSIE